MKFVLAAIVLLLPASAMAQTLQQQLDTASANVMGIMSGLRAQILTDQQTIADLQKRLAEADAKAGSVAGEVHGQAGGPPSHPRVAP